MFDPREKEALRACALTCWQNRQELALPVMRIEQVLVAFMAVGSDQEGKVASELLASMRHQEAKQLKFDELLGGEGQE